MKFDKLRKVCNSQIYALVVYGTPKGRIRLDLYDEIMVDRAELVKYLAATVLRVQPFIAGDGMPALEVELSL